MLIGLLVTLALIKVGFLVVFGPTVMPDTSGYTEFADFILAHRLTGPGLTEGDFPATLFRMAGYPLLIAATKIVAGDYALWVVAIFQIFLSLTATCFVFRLARAFGLSSGAAVFVAAAQATSLPLALDQVVITDSLNASLLTVASCLMAGAILDRSLRWPTALAAGLAIAVAFLLREATLFLAAGFLPLAIGAACSHRICRNRHAPKPEQAWRTTIKLACIVLPLAIAQQGYREWNRDRIGTPIVTTAAQTAVLYALAKAARHDATIFSGDAPLDRVARATLRTFDFSEIRQINSRLHREFGYRAEQISDMAYRAYFRAWRDHPAAMFRLPLTYLREWQMRLTMRPVASIRELILWNTGDDQDFGSERALGQGRWWMLPLVVLHRASEVLAIAVFVSFLLLTPWRLAREGIRSPPPLAIFGLWATYLTFFVVYAVVHLEPRYLAPVIPGSIVAGVVNLAWLREQWRRR